MRVFFAIVFILVTTSGFADKIRITKTRFTSGINLFDTYAVITERYNPETNSTDVVCSGRGWNKCRSIFERTSTVSDVNNVLDNIEIIITNSASLKGKGWYGKNLFYTWVIKEDVIEIEFFTGKDAKYLSGFETNPVLTY